MEFAELFLRSLEVRALIAKAGWKPDRRDLDFAMQVYLPDKERVPLDDAKKATAEAKANVTSARNRYLIRTGKNPSRILVCCDAITQSYSTPLLAEALELGKEQALLTLSTPAKDLGKKPANPEDDLFLKFVINVDYAIGVHYLLSQMGVAADDAPRGRTEEIVRGVREDMQDIPFFRAPQSVIDFNARQKAAESARHLKLLEKDNTGFRLVDRLHEDAWRATGVTIPGKEGIPNLVDMRLNRAGGSFGRTLYKAYYPLTA